MARREKSLELPWLKKQNENLGHGVLSLIKLS